MKCCSRSTLGVIIGGLNVIIYVGSIIYMLLDENDIKMRQRSEAVMIIFGFVLVLFAVMAFFSILLVYGIIQRRHSLMTPWLILSLIGFFCNVIQLLNGLCTAITSSTPSSHIFVDFLIGVFIIAIQALILYPIYTLYKDIRDRNNAANSVQVTYTTAQNGQFNIPVTPYNSALLQQKV